MTPNIMKKTVTVTAMLLALLASPSSAVTISYPYSLSPLTNTSQEILLGPIDFNNRNKYLLGDLFLGGIDALQADPNNNSTACWAAGNIARKEIYKMSESFNPSVILNNLQVLQIKIQNTFEACALRILVNYLDSRMSNLDYTLGIISNIISESTSGAYTEYLFVDQTTSAGLTNQKIADGGPDISVF